MIGVLVYVPTVVVAVSVAAAGEIIWCSIFFSIGVRYTVSALFYSSERQRSLPDPAKPLYKTKKEPSTENINLFMILAKQTRVDYSGLGNA